METRTAVPTVRRATSEDKDDVLDALLAGFANDIIVAGWLFTDPDTYAHYAGAFFGLYVDYALEHGYVWTTGDGIGALVGMSRTAYKILVADTDFQDRMIQAVGPHADRCLIFDQALDSRHSSTDHVFLQFIGVKPDHQSNGIGTALLQTAFAYADELGLPIYGESSCARNGRLYARLGLAPYGEPITLPGTESVLYSLWRPAIDHP